MTARSSRSIKRPQSDEEDKVRTVVSLGSVNLEMPISENLKFEDSYSFLPFSIIHKRRGSLGGRGG